MWSRVCPDAFRGIWEILKQNWETEMVYLRDCTFLRAITSHQSDGVTRQVMVPGSSQWRPTRSQCLRYKKRKKEKEETCAGKIKWSSYIQLPPTE